MQTRSLTKKAALLCNQPAVIKHKCPASQVFEDEPGSTQREVPDHLYNHIQRALDLEKQLQTSKEPGLLKSELEDVNLIITEVTEYYIYFGFLPSDWKYDPATAHTLVSKTFPTKKTSHKQKNMTPNPCIQYVKLDEGEMEAWRKFKEKDAAAKITAHYGISYPIDMKTIPRLSKGLDLFCVIGDFAVQAFNKSYQMYVNKDRNENIQSAQFVKSYYHKLSSSYLFNMTIEATEQGYAGTYEATVQCEFDDGAINLDTFIRKHRKRSRPKAKREVKETKKDEKSVAANQKDAKHVTIVEPGKDEDDSDNSDYDDGDDSDSSSTDSGSDEEGAGKSVSTKRSMYETVKDGWSDPEFYYEVSGMVRRRSKWGGYDFHSPNGWNRLYNF